MQVVVVPVVGALHRAATEVVSGANRSQRLGLSPSGLREKKAGHEGEKHAGHGHITYKFHEKGSARGNRHGPRPDQGNQTPEVGVPGDWLGRGFTSTG